MKKTDFQAEIRIFGAKKKLTFQFRPMNISLLANFGSFLEKNGFSARFPLFGKA